MLTQPLSTPDIGNKISPVAYPAPAPDQFGAVTGHAGLIATEFSYKKDEEIYGEDEPAEYVYQVISARFAATSCFPTDGVRSAHSICPVTSLVLNRDRSTGWQRMPSSIPPCDW